MKRIPQATKSRSPYPALLRFRQAIRTAAATWLATAGLALAGIQPALADTLLDNVDGMTLDREGKITRFNGLLIGDDGRIMQILGHKDKRPKKPAYVIDGKGRTVVPGFIDSHVELMAVGLAELTGGKNKGLPPPRPEDRDIAFAKAQRLLLSQGITAVADMGTTIEDWQAYRRAGDKGTLYIRVMAYAADAASMALIGGPGPSPWLYDDRLKFNGVRIELDGLLDQRGAALKAPYADDPATRGALLLGETQLRNMMSRAAIDNFQVAVSAHGDAAVASVLDAIDELSQTYKGERRWRIEGVELLDPADALRMAAHGAIASLRPGKLHGQAAVAESRLGPTRLASVQPWNSLALAGAKITFGSGTREGVPSPLAAMAAAITREDAQGQPFGGWQPQERLTREAALAAWTANAAFAGFAEGRFGRLVEGERADFVILERDPMLASPSELRAITVLESWVGGRKVYEAGQDTAAQYQEKMPGW